MTLKTVYVTVCDLFTFTNIFQGLKTWPPTRSLWKVFMYNCKTKGEMRESLPSILLLVRDLVGKIFLLIRTVTDETVFLSPISWPIAGITVPTIKQYLMTCNHLINSIFHHVMFSKHGYISKQAKHPLFLCKRKKSETIFQLRLFKNVRWPPAQCPKRLRVLTGCLLCSGASSCSCYHNLVAECIGLLTWFSPKLRLNTGSKATQKNSIIRGCFGLKHS